MISYSFHCSIFSELDWHIQGKWLCPAHYLGTWTCPCGGVVWCFPDDAHSSSPGFIGCSLGNGGCWDPWFWPCRTSSCSCSCYSDWGGDQLTLGGLPVQVPCNQCIGRLNHNIKWPWGDIDDISACIFHCSRMWFWNIGYCRQPITIGIIVYSNPIYLSGASWWWRDGAGSTHWGASSLDWEQVSGNLTLHT